MNLVATLEAGREDFLDATRGVSSIQASKRATPQCWSVLECIEHVVAVENRYLEWINRGAAVTVRRDDDKEIRLFTTVRNRLTKVEAPDVFHPQGRFTTLEAALAEFKAVRDRSVQLVQERGEALYAIGAKHPHFGNVNGVELIHLIDGHTRRHADQIREIHEARRREHSVNRAALKKPVAFKRDRPDLPPELESIEASDQLTGDGEFVTIEEKRLQDWKLTKLKIGTLRIEGSVLERVQLADIDLGSAVWKDVRLVGCDLANIRAHRVTFVRVELVDCRLTGFHARALDWKDVLIQNGDARYAQFQGGTFRTCEFDGCNLEDADLQAADLSGSLLRSCDLARTDLRKAKLRHTDFRRSEIEGMLVGMGDLESAIVDPAQAMILARLMGLQIL